MASKLYKALRETSMTTRLALLLSAVAFFLFFVLIIHQSASFSLTQKLTADFIAAELANDTNGVMFDCSSSYPFEAGCFRLRNTTNSAARNMLEIAVANYSELEWDTPWEELWSGDFSSRTLLVDTGKTFTADTRKTFTVAIYIERLSQVVIIGDVVFDE